jgi:hypothetical protein
VRNADGDHIVKARSPDGIVPEIHAYLNVLSSLAIPAPRLEHHSADAGLLVTSYLSGDFGRKLGEVRQRLAEADGLLPAGQLAELARRDRAGGQEPSGTRTA